MGSERKSKNIKTLRYSVQNEAEAYLFRILQPVRNFGSTPADQRTQNTSDEKSKTIEMKLSVSRTTFLKGLPDDNDDSGSESAPELKNFHYSHTFSLLSIFSYFFLHVFLHFLSMAEPLKKNGGLRLNLAFDGLLMCHVSKNESIRLPCVT